VDEEKILNLNQNKHPKVYATNNQQSYDIFISFEPNFLMKLSNNFISHSPIDTDFDMT
jgi:hypothetical protein